MFIAASKSSKRYLLALLKDNQPGLVPIAYALLQMTELFELEREQLADNELLGYPYSLCDKYSKSNWGKLLSSSHLKFEFNVGKGNLPYCELPQDVKLATDIAWVFSSSSWYGSGDSPHPDASSMNASPLSRLLCEHGVPHSPRKLLLGSLGLTFQEWRAAASDQVPTGPLDDLAASHLMRGPFNIALTEEPSEHLTFAFTSRGPTVRLLSLDVIFDRLAIPQMCGMTRCCISLP